MNVLADIQCIAMGWETNKETEKEERKKTNPKNHFKKIKQIKTPTKNQTTNLFQLKITHLATAKLAAVPSVSPGRWTPSCTSTSFLTVPEAHTPSLFMRL